MKITIFLLLSALLSITFGASLPLSVQQCSSLGNCGMYLSSLFDYPLQIFSFISLHLISLLTLFAAAQSLSVVLEGGAPTVNSYAGKVSSDGTTLTLSGTARLYMLNANGNAYQVFNNILLFSVCSHLLTIFCSCLISSTKRSATMSIPLKLDVEVMERCISTT